MSTFSTLPPPVTKAIPPATEAIPPVTEATFWVSISEDCQLQSFTQTQFLGWGL